jgi:hypothetical protein
VKITIEIELGNDEMQCGDSIATALEGIATSLREDDGVLAGDKYIVRDLNGNKVGTVIIET